MFGELRDTAAYDDPSGRAAELDLDPPTVAEHLQRAERNLLSVHLDAE